ncbi:MAG: 1-acyl-sn-glycerol-3-phosphate acyltransferase [Gammaproteobacteria bacterium]|nr:1-acyl-sn-glycerol-3-phosphate acyltransferase [Gammaproteobacteria bacterium]MDE2875041.1 1-acyl-sn-glycerol-3-phosphate acyltransferase [Gemmatimonadota bacterium]
MGRFARLVIHLLSTAAGIFYRVDRHGPPLPPGPLLVAVNHPNSLLDPVLVFRCSERMPRPLGRAPLFERLLLGPVLRMLGGIPVYRRQDDPDAMHRNEDMFRDAVAVLDGGGAIQIYPEGKSHSEAQLAEFRTGAARIALQAEDAAGWGLGLSIVPVGITYSRKERARTAVAVRFGPAFGCADLRDAFREDPVAAARRLTERIEAGIRAQTLNFVHHEDRELVEVAEQLYVRESRWVPWRAREELGARFPRLQRFAAGLEWIRREAPEEHRRLRRKVERYAAMNAGLGAGEGDVPPRFGLVPVAQYILGRGTLLLLGLPFAVAGTLLWAPVLRLAGLVVRRTRPDIEVAATHKLLALIGGVVLAWVFWVGLAYVLAGTVVAAVGAVLAPLCGYAALQWVELARELKEDTTLFLKLQGRPDVRLRFARMRRELAETFRWLEKRWEDEELQSSPDGGNVAAPGMRAEE